MDSMSNGFISYATYDDGSCPYIHAGCTNPNAVNFRSIANQDDGSCVYAGCLDSQASNFNPSATFTDRCVPLVVGCTNSHAANFYAAANTDDGSCLLVGCTDSTRLNFDSNANLDSGLCTPWFYGCTDQESASYDAFYTKLEASACIYLGCMDSSYANYDPRNIYDFSPSVCSNVRRTRRELETRRRLLACPDPTASNYNQEGTCTYPVRGCKDSYAINYASSAEAERSPSDCAYPIRGCTMQEGSLNYDSNAVIFEGCVFTKAGCMDSTASNFNAAANTHDSLSCTHDVYGCTAEIALNYDSLATAMMDGSCAFSVTGCMDTAARNFAADANTACVKCCTYARLGCMSQAALNFDSSANLDDGSCTVESPPPSPPPPQPPPSMPSPLPPPTDPPLPSPPPQSLPSAAVPSLKPPSSSQPLLQAFTPSQPSQVFVTIIRMVASGTVDDYTAALRSDILARFAKAAGVAESRVSLEVTAASVNLVVTITSTSKTAAGSVKSSLEPSLSSVAAATALLPPGVTVESVPTLEVVKSAELSSPPPASVSPPTAEGSSTVLAISAVVGAAGAALILSVACYLRKVRRRKHRQNAQARPAVALGMAAQNSGPVLSQDKASWSTFHSLPIQSQAEAQASSSKSDLPDASAAGPSQKKTVTSAVVRIRSHMQLTGGEECNAATEASRSGLPMRSDRQKAAMAEKLAEARFAKTGVAHSASRGFATPKEISVQASRERPERIYCERLPPPSQLATGASSSVEALPQFSKRATIASSSVETQVGCMGRVAGINDASTETHGADVDLESSIQLDLGGD